MHSLRYTSLQRRERREPCRHARTARKFQGRSRPSPSLHTRRLVHLTSPACQSLSPISRSTSSRTSTLLPSARLPLPPRLCTSARRTASSSSSSMVRTSESLFVSRAARHRGAQRAGGAGTARLQLTGSGARAGQASVPAGSRDEFAIRTPTDGRRSYHPLPIVFDHALGAHVWDPEVRPRLAG